jgi:hypothetical protein
MAKVRDSLFDLSLAAFASIGLPVTLLSSIFGLVRTIQRAPAERVGSAINFGLAIGLVPEIALATVVLVNGIKA